jgi:hypothetical protein
MEPKGFIAILTRPRKLKRIMSQLNSACNFTPCFFYKQQFQTIELLIVSEVTAYSH